MKTLTHLALLTLIGCLVLPSVGLAQDISTPKDVFSANLEATGGSASWADVHDAHFVTENVMEFPQGVLVTKVETWIIRSGYMVSKTKTLESPAGFPEGVGDATIYLTPDAGWIKSFQGKQDIDSLPSGMGAQVRAGLKIKEETDLIERPDSVYSLEEGDLEGVASWVVAVADETPTRRFYSKSDFSLLGVEITAPGLGTIVRSYTEYRKVGDLTVSFGTEADLGPTGSQTSSVKSMEFNTELTPESLAAMVEE